jgi:plastocyanin
MWVRGLRAIAGVLGAVALLAPAIASSQTTPTIDAENLGGGIYGETHRWQPAQVTVELGGSVTLANPTKALHGVEWRSAVKPSCEEGAGKVPVGSTPAVSGASWSGSCSFSQAGSYTFYCTVHGPEMTGTITVPGTPTASTEAATAVTQTGATLAGVVDPQGQATHYYFEYGTASVSEHTTAIASVGAADFSGHQVSTTIAGLSPSGEYHVQLVAIYGAAETAVLGGEQTLTTPAIAAPTTTTGAAGAVGETVATLAGSVNSNGGGATEYDFVYGTSASYGQATAVVKGLPADGLTRQVSAMLVGLQPGTTYHFRLMASNEVGPASGEDMTFTTTSRSPAPAEPPSTPPTTSALAAALPGTALGMQAPAPSPSPLAGSAARAVRLLVGRGGLSVRGAVAVSAAGAGGRLEVDLLLRRGSRLVRVGRLMRSHLRPGTLSFTLALNASAARALRSHRRLTVTAKLALVPLHGTTVRITRSLVLHR